MMNKSIRFSLLPLFLAVLSLFAAVSHAADPADPAHVIKDTSAGFTYVAPKGWSVGQFRSTAAFTQGDKGDDFAPNITVHVDESTDSLSKFVKDRLGNSPTIKVTSQTEFVTQAKAKGIRVVLTGPAGDKDETVRFVFYFFAGKSPKKYTIIFAELPKPRNRFDNVVDTSVRTFKML